MGRRFDNYVGASGAARQTFKTLVPKWVLYKALRRINVSCCAATPEALETHLSTESDFQGRPHDLYCGTVYRSFNKIVPVQPEPMMSYCFGAFTVRFIQMIRAWFRSMVVVLAEKLTAKCLVPHRIQNHSAPILIDVLLEDVKLLWVKERCA